MARTGTYQHWQSIVHARCCPPCRHAFLQCTQCRLALEGQAYCQSITLSKASKFPANRPYLQRVCQQLQHVCPLRKHQQPRAGVRACDGQHPPHHRLQLHEHKTNFRDEIDRSELLHNSCMRHPRPENPREFELFPGTKPRRLFSSQKRTLTHIVDRMDASKFTEKTIQALNAAQEFAVESGHQQVCRLSCCSACTAKSLDVYDSPYCGGCSKH